MIAKAVRIALLVGIAAAVLPRSGSAQVFHTGGHHTVALQSDGTLAVWGHPADARLVAPTSGLRFTAVAGGLNHSLALLSDGTVAVWGSNDSGQVTGTTPTADEPQSASVVAPVTNVTAIAGGGYHSLALRADGTVVAWGKEGSPQVDDAISVSQATAISAGVYHSLALRSDGTVAAWGDTADGKISGAGSIESAVAISAGGYHSLALLSDGKVYAWGKNEFGQVSGPLAGLGPSAAPSSLTDVAAISAGESHSLALRSDGTVAAWGNDQYGRVSGATSLQDVVHVSAGAFHSYAIHADGTISGWGLADNDRLNTPDTLVLPTETHWTAATDGDYLNSHRWDEKIPSTALSNAVFDVDSGKAYTVEFGNDAWAKNLTVSAGDVHFAQNGTTYHVQDTLTLSGEGTRLDFDGAIESHHINITGHALSAGTITSTGTVQIGSQSTLTASVINNEGLITIASGGSISANTIHNNGTIAGSLDLNRGELLSGTGSITGDLTVANGGRLAPGSSVGAMLGDNATFGAGGVFDFEISDPLGTAGGEGSWDVLELSGTLSLTATEANPFIVNIRSLDLANFDASRNYSWAFVTAREGITGFDQDWFSVDSAGFTEDLGGGSFSIAQMDDSLVVNFNSSLTGVPEPSSLAVLGICGLGWAGYRRRCQKHQQRKDAQASTGSGVECR